MLNYTLEVSNLGTLTAEQFALMLVRFNQLKEIYPPTAPQVQAPQAMQSQRFTSGESAICSLYKLKMNYGRAAVKAEDFSLYCKRLEQEKAFIRVRLNGFTMAKGNPPTGELKDAILAQVLLENGKATQEEIASAIEQGANASAMFEPLDETPNEGDADAGIDAL